MLLRQTYVNAGDLSGKPDTSSAMDAARHDGFDQRAQTFVLDRPNDHNPLVAERYIYARSLGSFYRFSKK